MAELEQICAHTIKIAPDGSDHQMCKDIPVKNFGDNVEGTARFWIKRMLLLANLNKLVRIYNKQKEAYLKRDEKDQDPELLKAYKRHTNLLACVLDSQA